ncbi:MAG: hypothetical protein V4473_01375 [Patescibacteria group bacterium]
MKALNPELKRKAKILRSKGKSYNEIAQILKISKNTARYWCKDIILKDADQKRLYTKGVLLLAKGQYGSHERRRKEIAKINDNAAKEILFPLHPDTYKLFGAALYWAEGNKVNDFTVTNSDPLLIQFMTQWFCNVFGLTPNDFKAHLNIYPQQDDFEIKKFWSDITGIPLDRFGKTFVKPLNKNYKKNTLYYGTIKVRVNKGTDYRHRVFGWINTVLKNMKQDVEITERKWYKLRANMRP